MFITIDQILALRAIYQEGSLSKAADSLFKAKSALNYSIKALEEQLGFALLDKSGYRLALSPKGQEFLKKSHKLLLEYDELLEGTGNIRTGIESRLAMSGSSICSLDNLYKVTKAAMSKYPNTEITFHRETLSGEKLLESGVVDLALFEELNNKQDFEYKELGILKMPLMISSDHEFLKLKKKEQTLKELKKYPHIIQESTIKNPYGNRSMYEDSIQWKVTDTLSKSEIICAGLGWGRLPFHMVKDKIKANKLTYLKHIGDEPKLKIYLCRKKHKTHGAVNNFIWDSF